MKRLFAILLIVALLAAGCAQPTETPQPLTPTPTATPIPYMPSAKYRFTPPYSAKFDLESSKGFNIRETDALKEHPVLRKYAELPLTKYISILPQGNSGIATLVLTSTFDEDFDISVKVKVGEWLTDKVPEGIRVAPSSDVIYLKAREQTSLGLEVKVAEDTPSGLYYVDVIAAIEGYRYEAVLWVLVSTYTTVPLSWAYEEDTAYLAVVEGVVSVIEGIVEKKEGTFTGERSRPTIQNDEEKRQRASYSDWSVQVVRYLVDPFPHERITLWKIEGYIVEDGSPLPHRWTYHLSEGERAIFFLAKKAWDLLEDDQFTLWEGSPFVQGKVPIEEGKVRVRHHNRDSVEFTETFINRLQIYAQEAGRTVPEETSAILLSPSPEEGLEPPPYRARFLIPAPGSRIVPVTTPISVTFIPRPPGIVELEIKPQVDIGRVESEFIDEGPRKVTKRFTFYPAEPLQPETTYTVTLTFGQEQPPGPGSAATKTITWQFTTAPE